MNKYTYVNTGGWRILTFQFGNLLGSKTFRLLSHLRNYVLTFLRTEEFGVIWNQRRRGDVIKSNKDELRGDKLCIFYHVILGSFELITRDRGGYRFPAILNLLSDVPSCFNFLINERRNLWHSCNSLTSFSFVIPCYEILLDRDRVARNRVSNGECVHRAFHRKDRRRRCQRLWLYVPRLKARSH